MNFGELQKQSKYIDTHCHLNDKAFDGDRDEVVERAKKAGVQIVDMAVDLRSSRIAIENAKKYDNVYATVGIDAETLIPESDLYNHDLANVDIDFFKGVLEKYRVELWELAKAEEVVMIGETGMDDYWFERAINEKKIKTWQREQYLDRQEMLFKLHIDLANEMDLPLSVHSRNCIRRCLKLLQENKVKNAVFHSLTPDLDDTDESFEEIVREIHKAGYLVGINAIATFKSAENIRNVYKRILDGATDYLSKGFIFETDAPYLAPAPYRGERNEPSYIPFIIENL